MNNDLNNRSDEELIKKAKSGDQQSLELLVCRYMPLVYGVAMRYLRTSDEAEDATQEVFVKIWRNLRKFKAEKRARPWIMEITKNTCLDLLKKKRAVPFAAFENADGTNALTENLATTKPSPADLAEASLSKNLLNVALNKLSSQYQKILTLYYNEGLNFREIAKELHESINTVKSRHRRALILLRGLIS